MNVMEKDTKHFRMLEPVGEGEIGVLYKAYDTKLDALRTVQVVRAALGADPRFMASFTQAAKDLARLDHPHILTIFWFFEQRPNPFLVMEYVDGVTLADVIRHSAPLRYRQALPLFKQVLDGLAYAHEKGVTHRDLRPSNILVSREGQIKIAGFGLTKNQQGEDRVGGTPSIEAVRYLSPEHVRSRAVVDARSDMYAVGAMLYEALAGRPVFEEDEAAYLLLRAIIEDEITPLAQVAPGVPDDLAAVVMKALARDPADRFSSAAAFRGALEAFEARAPVSEPAPPPVVPGPSFWQRVRTPLGYAALFALLAATLVIGWWALRDAYSPPVLPAVMAVAQTDSLALTTGIYEQVLPSVNGNQPHIVLQAFPYGDLYLANKKIGADSVSIAVNHGAQQVRCTHPVYGTQEAVVEVGPGQRKEVICYFEAYLRVQTTTEEGVAYEAELYVDNQATGRRTPLQQPYALGPGAHTVEVYRTGYLGGATTIRVQPGGTESKIATPPVASLAFLLQKVN